MSQQLEVLHAAIDACTICASAGLRLQKPVRLQRGLVTAAVMGIGIAPGSKATRTGMAFAGHSFTRIRSWFAEAGFDVPEGRLRAALYLTSLNKCGVAPDTHNNRRHLWRNCQRFLWQQLDLVRPRLVLILGEEPARLLGATFEGGYASAVGQSLAASELFGLNLFPVSEIRASWLLMPHPSGLSRVMNDQIVAKRVMGALRDALTAISFSA